METTTNAKLNNKDSGASIILVSISLTSNIILGWENINPVLEAEAALQRCYVAKYAANLQETTNVKV